MGIVENAYAELKQQELKNNPYSCLHMADIDINPHQIEAFTFALSSLELGGAILADEVGLGKTIEAGLVIKYLLCSGKNKILLIMPSNLRKQWQVELEEKFDIDSLIVDSSNWEDYLAKVKSKQAVIIVSYHFASKRKTEFGKIAWDFCVFDEAHRLRNVYKNGSKMANSLYELTKGIPKILLTATPMQNTLLDIYGLVQFIDDRVFYSTPKSTNKNIIYHYGLEDGAGKFLKIPVVMGRTNTAGYSDDDIEEMKLKDGIKLHERRKSIVYKYCIDNQLEQVKPIVLIACKDTTHARKIKEKIDSDAFLEAVMLARLLKLTPVQVVQRQKKTFRNY